jgi:hypothetical protein
MFSIAAREFFDDEYQRGSISITKVTSTSNCVEVEIFDLHKRDHQTFMMISYPTHAHLYDIVMCILETLTSHIGYMHKDLIYQYHEGIIEYDGSMNFLHMVPITHDTVSLLSSTEVYDSITYIHGSIQEKDGTYVLEYEGGPWTPPYAFEKVDCDITYSLV